MTIQRKLLFLLVGTLGALLIGFGGFLYFYFPTEAMDDEKMILIEVGLNLRELHVLINSIDKGAYALQLAEIKARKELLLGNFQKLENFKALPRANKDIRRALEIIHGLEVLFQQNWNAFEQAANDMTAVIKNILLSEDVTVTAYRLSKNASFQARQSGELDAALLQWEGLLSQIGVMEVGLLFFQEMFDKQLELIDKVLQIEKRNSIRFGLIIIGFIFLASLFIALLISRSMVQSFVVIEEGIERLKEDDLTVSIGVKTRDDLGLLSSNLMEFVHKLKKSVEEFKSSSREHSLVKDDLAAVVTAASNDTQSIGASTAEINDVIDLLSGSIVNSGQATRYLMENIQSLKGQLLEQLTMVEETASAVTEMIASIGSVTKVTEQKGQTTETLVQFAAAGRTQLEETIEIIDGVNNFVDEISGTAAIIQTVASQTNILAMNAAIEAAHAGEAGRGFAVVADQIRSLAETTADNSKRIGQVLKEVVTRITKASEAGRATHEVFFKINQEVDGVFQGFLEISGSMSELNIGSQQILEAMSQLRQVSESVKTGSTEMEKAAERLEEGSREVQEISGDVKAGTLDIQGAIEGIIGSMEQVKQIIQRLDDVSELLHQEAFRFTTENPVEADGKTENSVAEKMTEENPEEIDISEEKPEEIDISEEEPEEVLALTEVEIEDE